MEQEEVNPSVRVEVKTLEMAIEILRRERERGGRGKWIWASNINQ